MSLGDGEGKHFRADNFLSSAAAAFRMINAQQQQNEKKKLCSSEK
jgi:hypothetical protein